MTYTHIESTCVCIYLRIHAQVYMCVYVVPYMHTELTCVCVNIYVYARRVHVRVNLSIYTRTENVYVYMVMYMHTEFTRALVCIYVYVH